MVSDFIFYLRDVQLKNPSFAARCFSFSGKLSSFALASKVTGPVFNSGDTRLDFRRSLGSGFAGNRA